MEVPNHEFLVYLLKMVGCFAGGRIGGGVFRYLGFRRCRGASFAVSQLGKLQSSAAEVGALSPRYLCFRVSGVMLGICLNMVLTLGCLKSWAYLYTSGNRSSSCCLLRRRVGSMRPCGDLHKPGPNADPGHYRLPQHL